jgi:predicted CXXCH cytochrome family protein
VKICLYAEKSCTWQTTRFEKDDYFYAPIEMFSSKCKNIDLYLNNLFFLLMTVSQKISDRKLFLLRPFFAGLTLLIVFASCNNKGKSTVDSEKGLIIQDSNYVGDLACMDCHKKEYDDWLGSHHDMAMKPANENTVLGNFNNVEFEANGVVNYFSEKGNKYFIRIIDIDGSEQEYEIKYTFGWTPLQQYLVQFPGGRLQVLRASWDVIGKKWFHQNENETIPTTDWMHWSNSAMTWNTMCADCHSTGYKKNYNVSADTFQSGFVWVNVSCEACHGPGKKHLDFVKSEKYNKANGIPQGDLFMTQNISSVEQVEQCAPCHARRTKLIDGFHPERNFNDIYSAQLISDDYYFPDGQILEEDYVYGSFVQSKMYHRGIKCSNCHNPHSLNLVKQGNDLCLQCHDAAVYPKPEHHFHKENSEASKCVNCHMTGRVYMGNDFRRDHSFRVPRPDQSVLYNTPNACNDCHQDKDANWAAKQVEKWYGPDRKKHFSDILLKASLGLPGNADQVRAFISDTSYPVIARATAVSYLGQTPGGLDNETIHRVLQSDEKIMQKTMISAMPEIDSLTYSILMNRFLTDPFLSFRMNTINRLLGMDYTTLSPDLRNDYERALFEYQSALEMNADFREGKLFLGNYYERMGRVKQAEKFYKRAVDVDSLFVEARMALAVVCNQTGKNGQAMKQLNAILEIENDNSRAWYLKGLLYAELKDFERAADMITKAVELDSLNIDYYYNLALIKQQLNKLDESVNLLNSALVIEPESEKINYAMAYALIKQQRWTEAKQYVSWLNSHFPGNEQYKQMQTLVNNKLSD